jgi:hypothetical protein
MRIVFSVILSALKFLSGGILTWDGSMSEGGSVEETGGKSKYDKIRWEEKLCR